MSSRELFKEFEFLLEKSQRSFNRLRDLPPYGNSRWEHHFHKAFSIYSKLWKFQQDNREVLTSRGMERWEVGDIASKIGQLYYNYYLRTSEIRFLHESYVFYEAIRSRAYFAQAATDPNLAIKQLRYFARFIIICLLLNRREEVWQLLQEFQALISAYIMKYSPPDTAEWRSVINEVTHFLNADVAMPMPRAPGSSLPFRISLRCAPNQPEVKLQSHKMLLHDAVLVSYYPRQVKIAELPLDSFRMLQALEWEDQFSGATPPPGEHPLPVGKASRGGKAGTEGGGDGGMDPAPKTTHENPAKHLVYRPTAMQLLSILNATVESLPKEAMLLLYISAASSRGGGGELLTGGSGRHGVTSSGSLASEISPAAPESVQLTPDNMSEASACSSTPALAVCNATTADGVFLGPPKGGDAAEACLLPEDLTPLTRRSLFLVVDSDNAAAFGRLSGQEVGRTAFGLLSPAARPTELGEAAKMGNLLTLFLTAPLSAVCLVAGNTDPSTQQLVDLQSAFGGVMGDWGALAARILGGAGAGGAGTCGGGASTVRSPWAVAFRDALLRRLLLRFVLCRAMLALHRGVGTSSAHLPRCFPDLPREVAPDTPEVVAGVQRLAAALGRTSVFGSRALSVSDASSPMSVSTSHH